MSKWKFRDHPVLKWNRFVTKWLEVGVQSRGQDGDVVVPRSFHADIRDTLTTKMPCADCVKPLCSCSGAHEAKVLFLPGEKQWIESNTGMKFERADERGFMVCGDCVFLQDKVCQAGEFRPWDDISFPLQPTHQEGILRVDYATNCTIRPVDLDGDWMHERWRVWLVLNSLFPHWIKEYVSEPPHR